MEEGNVPLLAGAAPPTFREGKRRLRGSPKRLLAFALVFALLCFLFWGRQVTGRALRLTAIWIPVLLSQKPPVIADALQRSGPVFIKLAQWASTRRDLLSSDLCDALGELHENVKCTAKPEDIEDARAAAPGLELGALLGGGCIAQVYAGELSGSKVAVKIRRREVVKLLETDLVILKFAAGVAERLSPSLRWLSLHDAVDNFGWYLQQQVDLTIEAENNRRFIQNFRDKETTIPDVKVATESVMVTDLAPGHSLSKFIREDHPAEIRKEVFELLVDIMAQMILKDKFIHGDLHPGNVFVNLIPRGKKQVTGEAAGAETVIAAREVQDFRPHISLIDTGISIEMNDNLATFAREGVTASFAKDANGLGEAVWRLHMEEGLCDHAQDVPTLTHKVGHLLLSGAFMVGEDIWGEVFPSWDAYNGTRVSEYFTMMLDLLSQHKVRICPDLWTLMTAFALIEGSVQELGYGVNVLGAAAPYIFSGPQGFLGRLLYQITCKKSEAKHRRESFAGPAPRQ